MKFSESRTFIETSNFPVDDVNETSAKEKGGGGRPDYWEMVFWWTRKPLAGARAVIAGSLLPASTNLVDFKYYLRLIEKIVHRKNPSIPPKWRKIFENACLLDPFAGFGSIPLEALRLGIGKVVAVELLPTAYVFLKAVLEYPKWAIEKGLGQKLIKDVEYWGKWVTKRLREDPDVRELYDDVAVYISTWEILCPHCGKWTPIVGNWWLARVSKETTEGTGEGTKSGEFKRLAWMMPVKTGDNIAIKVIDLNKELGRKIIKAKVNTRQGTVIVDEKKYTVPRKNIDARRETAMCLHCNNQIRKRNKQWYIREILRDWNQKLEQYLAGQVTLKTLQEQVKVRPRILVKVKVVNGDLEFQSATHEDQEKIWRALEKLKQTWGDPDIPTESLWPYISSGGGRLSIITWGFDKFYKLFNPRQLLTLIKLVKLIREAGKKIEKKRLKEEWSREKAFKYAEAVTTYLAIALCKYADYNSMETRWRSDLLRFEATFAQRGIAMMWNWCDAYPFMNIPSISGSWIKVHRNVIVGLFYLISVVGDGRSRVKVLLDDATTLSKLDEKKFDIIVTDPPYRDDVPYAELSDFYYVWLKRALSDVIDVGGLLVRQPRFIPEAFFRDGTEIEVQWKYFADKEVSEDEGRSKFFGEGVGSLEHFKWLLAKSFQTMANLLKDDGILVTYYAHTSPDAWEALLDAGWRGAGLRITAAHAVVTESKHRVTARGKAGLDVSIVAVWRKGSSGQVLAGEVYSKAIEECTNYASNLLEKGLNGVNLFVSVLGRVLSVFTGYERVIGAKTTKELVEKYVYPATAEAIAQAIGGTELAAKLSSTSLFYLLGKVLITRRPGQTRRTLDRSTTTILSIGTRNDVMELKRLGLIEQERDKFRLLEPAWKQRDLVGAIRSALEKRRIDPRNPVARTPIDVLHLLEYYSVTLPKDEFLRKAEEFKARYPALYEEAVGIARLLARTLPSNDPERELTRRVVDVLSPLRTGLDKFLGDG